jgi:predicted nucleotidyltransferase component of viral defense system
MLSRADLQRLANREKVALGILEKDYVLTELLKALSVVPKLYNLLVFKGGHGSSQNLFSKLAILRRFRFHRKA